MPGEKAKIVRGPNVPIRVTAPVDMDAGDFYLIAGTGTDDNESGCVGFFPDAVKRNEVGTFIIAAKRVEVERKSGDTAAHIGGEAVIYNGVPTNKNRHMLVFGGNTQNARRYWIGYVSEDTPADSDTIQFTFNASAI